MESADRNYYVNKLTIVLLARIAADFGIILGMGNVKAAALDMVAEGALRASSRKKPRKYWLSRGLLVRFSTTLLPENVV